MYTCICAYTVYRLNRRDVSNNNGVLPSISNIQTEDLRHRADECGWCEHFTSSVKDRPPSFSVHYWCDCDVVIEILNNCTRRQRRLYYYTSQPSYLNDLISVQPPRSTRCSSVVTLSRPPTISSLKITDRSFRYATPRLWNQLPDSFHEPRQSCLDSPPHSLVSSSLSSPLSSSITPSLFHSRLKTYLFNKSFPP